MTEAKGALYDRTMNDISGTIDGLTRAQAAVSSTLLEMLRRLQRIEERLDQLVALVGADVGAGMEIDTSDNGQSVLRRQWDPSGQRWVYEPETPS